MRKLARGNGTQALHFAVCDQGMGGHGETSVSPQIYWARGPMERNGSEQRRRSLEYPDTPSGRCAEPHLPGSLLGAQVGEVRGPL